MRTRRFVARGVLCVVMAVLASCDGGSSSPTFPLELIQQIVNVAANGGAGEVRFNVSNGWRIRMTLQAANSTMIPYGYLECQSGTGAGEYQPPQDTAQNGQNSVELSLTQTGLYIFTIFDGSNQGGTVTVIIERLS